MHRWSIPTDRLTGPRRLGGRISRRGFAFQDAYACWQLTRLLDSSQGVLAVRPEGAQDVDVLYHDGREQYIQLKHEPDEPYTLATLRSILQGFAVDLLEARRPTSLALVLVARSGHINAGVSRLRDGCPSGADIGEVAGFLSQGSASPSLALLASLSDRERYDLAEQCLQQTQFLFGMGDEVDGRFSFESHACTALALRGIAGSGLANAYNALKSALERRREFTASDLEEVLKRYLAQPLLELFGGRVEALAYDLLSQPANPNRIQQFYAGAPLDWDILAAQGDIPRDQQEGLLKQLREPSNSLRFVCIVAEPGAGKSTLAWRTAATLHQEDGALVLRVKDKEDPDVWYLIGEFCRKIKRPFYALADDLFRDADVVSALRELNVFLPITVLATSRANEYRPSRLKAEVIRVPLSEPSRDEKERILRRVGKPRGTLTPEQEKRLDGANQFRVLMMELTAGKKLVEIVTDALLRVPTKTISRSDGMSIKSERSDADVFIYQD